MKALSYLDPRHPERLAHKEAGRPAGFDFAKLPVEYHLTGKMVMKVHPRLSYLQENFSYPSFEYEEWEDEVEKLLKNGESVLIIREEKHALHLVLHGICTDSARDELRRLLDGYLIPSVETPTGDFLLDLKWKTAR